jgi:hypothetical protein
MINNRKKDSIVEREIAKFIDAHLYENKEIFKEYARTDGKEEQIKGSDVVLSTSDGKLNRVVVDEKVAARYANSGLGTFTLELSFIGRNGNKKCGWFIDNTKTTQYYLFGWLNKVDIPYNEKTKRWETDLIKSENIKELEWCLVSKDKILKSLEKKGWTIEKLAKQDEAIRKKGYVKTKEFIDDVAFRYSDAYIEKPINIMLKKETYLKLSNYKGIIKA